jgi:hypothetical protein
MVSCSLITRVQGRHRSWRSRRRRPSRTGSGWAATSPAPGCGSRSRSHLRSPRWICSPRVGPCSVSAPATPRPSGPCVACPTRARQERVDRMIELIDTSRRLLSGDEVTFTGTHSTLQHGRLETPRPLQQPLPLLVGGNGRRVLRYAAAHADSVGLSGLGRTLEDGHRMRFVGHPSRSAHRSTRSTRRPARLGVRHNSKRSYSTSRSPITPKPQHDESPTGCRGSRSSRS